MLLVLLLLHQGGEVAEVLELLRLAEELHGEERVGRRRRHHGVDGAEAAAAAAGAGRRERGVLVRGVGEEGRAAGVAGARVVGLGGGGAGRVEGAHGDVGGRAEAGGERFWVGF